MPSPEILAKGADSPEGRKQLAEWLNDQELFSAMLDAGTPIMQAFERERLQPMYARVHKAIREVDRHNERRSGTRRRKRWRQTERAVNAVWLSA